MMTIAKIPRTPLLTYEEYLEEGYVEGSYDIVDGERIFMPGATWGHQQVAGNIYVGLRAYGATSRRGKALMAPFDVLIRRRPRLRTRQPDVFFISNEQLAASGGTPQLGVLEVAPELVVEVISDSETERRVEAKILDYCEIGVQEMWRVWPETRTVEVLRLTRDGATVSAVYGEADMIQSLTFSDLTLSVAAIFAE
jgi:Uma2 family endonuclease